MKRVISVFLILAVLPCMFFLGCKKKEGEAPPAQEYVVNDSSVISVGVIVPLSGEFADLGNKVLEGIEYANETASGIKLDKEYSIELVTQDISDVDSAFERFTSNKVTAVIAYGGNKENTDNVLSKFGQSGIPLIFIDNHSELISATANVFSIGSNYNYQASAAVTFLVNSFVDNGVVLIAEDNTFNRSFADMFMSTLQSSGGGVSDVYAYDNTDASVEKIISTNPSFVFVIGSEPASVKCTEILKAKGYMGQIVLNEIIDKSLLSDDGFERTAFISKLEPDDDNFIGSDFINVYSESKEIEKSQVLSATAYGYDSYMLVYETLHSFATSDPLAGVSGNKSSNDTVSEITLSGFSEALGKAVYYGVIDIVSFDENGMLNIGSLYIDKVISGKAQSVDKITFNK